MILFNAKLAMECTSASNTEKPSKPHYSNTNVARDKCAYPGNHFQPHKTLLFIHNMWINHACNVDVTVKLYVCMH